MLPIILRINKHLRLRENVREKPNACTAAWNIFPRRIRCFGYFPLVSVPVAQPDRASDFGSEGWGFESLRARELFGSLLRHCGLFGNWPVLRALALVARKSGGRRSLLERTRLACTVWRLAERTKVRWRHRGPFARALSRIVEISAPSEQAGFSWAEKLSREKFSKKYLQSLFD